MQRLKRALPALLALVFLVTACNAAAWLLTPARVGYGVEWDAYLQEEPDSLDVLFFGSSMVYCNVVPALVWETSGLRSFLMAAPAQPMSMTYYYVKEACKTQRPQAIVVEAGGLLFDKYPGHSKANLAYMPWGLNRVLATLKGAEREEWLGALFPLSYYHDRVYDITWKEIQGRLSPKKDPLMGYTLLTDAVPQKGAPRSKASAETETYRENLAYLQKIADFCQTRGIRLLLFLAPTYETHPPETLARLARDVRALPGATYFTCDGPDWPLADPATQWFDHLHLNCSGAIPFSRRLGRELSALGLTPTGEDAQAWQTRLDHFTARLPAPQR